MEIVTTTALYHNKEMDLSDDDKYHLDMLPGKIIFLVFYSLVFVFSVLGNGVFIWVTGFKMEKTVLAVWYLNLAVAAFLLTAFLPLRMTYVALDYHWPFGKFMCKMNSIVFFLHMYASVYILMVISVDRCVCVVCPVWARNHRSVRKASRVSLGVWVLALALSSPFLVFTDTRPSYHDEDVIKCYNNFALTSYGVMTVTDFLLGLLVPFTVIIPCYCVIYYHVIFRNNRSLAAQSGLPRKVIVCMAYVSVGFAQVWSFFHVIHLVNFANGEVAVYSEQEQPGGLFSIALSVTLLLSCLNPLNCMFTLQSLGIKDVFSRSILKVLEKTFTEELPQTDTSTNPGGTSQETPLSETQV